MWKLFDFSSFSYHKIQRDIFSTRSRKYKILFLKRLVITRSHYVTPHLLTSEKSLLNTSKNTHRWLFFLQIPKFFICLFPTTKNEKFYLSICINSIELNCSIPKNSHKALKPPHESYITTRNSVEKKKILHVSK